MSWYKDASENFRRRQQDLQKQEGMMSWPDSYAMGNLEKKEIRWCCGIKKDVAENHFAAWNRDLDIAAAKHKYEHELRRIREKHSDIYYSNIKKEDKEKSSHKIAMINERNKELGHE